MTTELKLIMLNSFQNTINAVRFQLKSNFEREKNGRWIMFRFFDITQCRQLSTSSITYAYNIVMIITWTAYVPLFGKSLCTISMYYYTRTMKEKKEEDAHFLTHSCNFSHICRLLANYACESKLSRRCERGQ